MATVFGGHADKMEHDILKKEEEFRKENKLLEIKTREILQKVDDIKKMQELKLLESKPEKTRVIDPEDIHVPKSVDEMGTKGMMQFYKSKIKTLQEDSEKTRNELKNKTEELKKLQKSHQSVSEEKEKWFLQYNMEKNSNAKLERQISACNSKLQLKDTENAAMKKEIEQLKVDLKNSYNELSASENRLRRAMQEIEKYRNMLQTARHDEKEAKEIYRTNLKDLTANVRQIHKHKNELLEGYKKQIQLIDNLKRQKAHVESCKVLELAEDEFFKLLDWKIN